MPLYDFVCDCGHMHEGFTQASVRTVECPSCGGEAARELSSTIGLAYTNENPEGLTPQLTGAASVDFSFDHVVSEDARKQWQVIDERTAYKREVLEDSPGASMADLSRQHDGTYQVMPSEARSAVESVRDSASEAIRRQKDNGGPNL